MPGIKKIHFPKTEERPTMINLNKINIFLPGDTAPAKTDYLDPLSAERAKDLSSLVCPTQGISHGRNLYGHRLRELGYFF
jgi:hypothetical protein